MQRPGWNGMNWITGEALNIEGGNGMDCIKEEALRLKGMAEQMITSKEYNRARNKLNEAKELFPKLENVSQMLTVCDILCAADIDFPSGKDWYFILQLTDNDDEGTIRSRYQKLYLDLEPIKDEFPGTKTATEFLDKSMSVLCDRKKRSVFDAKRKDGWKSSGHAHLITSSTYPTLHLILEDNPLIVKKTVKEEANPVTLENDSSLEERENEQENEPFPPTTKRGRLTHSKSTVGPSKKQKSKVAMIREATEGAMNEFSRSVSHHTAAPSTLPSENQSQDSLQPSLQPLQVESGDHSPYDSPNYSPNYSPSPSPSSENPATPLEILPSVTIVDYITDLRQLIIDESPSSPEPQSSISIELESTEIQNAKKIVGMASSMELELFVSEEFQVELKNAIDILLADENKTLDQTSNLLNFHKYIERLVPNYNSYLEDLDAAERASSDANFLRQTLSQMVDQMERLADVNRKCKQEKESILEEKHNLKVRVRELSQQLTKTETSLADNLRLMKELVAKTEEDKMSFKTKMIEKSGWKIKEKDAKKSLEHLHEVWEDKRKLIRNIGSNSMEGRKEKI
ncbi:uncharacterized protein LOC143861599 [Tasmannia lanceolata]|uniref:uncharacterized protein LOC143861599 n=1 Tax=Tasmannia lanceolata TaxID=3420 RepID=UPI0040647D1B